MFWVHISKFTVFYMYIFTPIYFQNQKVIVNHNYQYLINIYRVQVGTYGCIWVLMGVLIQNNDKIGKVGTGGACACMIWPPGGREISRYIMCALILLKNLQNE